MILLKEKNATAALEDAAMLPGLLADHQIRAMVHPNHTPFHY